MRLTVPSMTAPTSRSARTPPPTELRRPPGRSSPAHRRIASLPSARLGRQYDPGVGPLVRARARGLIDVVQRVSHCPPNLSTWARSRVNALSHTAVRASEVHSRSIRRRAAREPARHAACYPTPAQLVQEVLLLRHNAQAPRPPAIKPSRAQVNASPGLSSRNSWTAMLNMPRATTTRTHEAHLGSSFSRDAGLGGGGSGCTHS
jgi:hypothetical protein